MKKYTAVSVRQLDRKGKPWQARAKYKDVYGKWKELSKMLPDAKGKRDAQRIANEWLDTLNAQADLMPNAGKASTVDKTYREYLKRQLDTGEIEKSTYSNSLHSYKGIKCIETGQLFDTVGQAAKAVGLKSKSSILKCLNNSNKTAAKYHWASLEKQYLPAAAAVI